MLLLYGGDSIFSQVKRVYKVEAVNVKTEVKTVFYVIAENEIQAGEQVSLNGWNVESVVVSGGYNHSLDNRTTIKESPKLKYILTVYFDPCKYSTILDNKTIDTLKSLNEKGEYIVYGHTDSVPTITKDDFRNNYELSLKRAKFLKDFIVNISNIPLNNIKIVGLGEFYPLVDNNIDGARLNRRAEIYERY
jgi:hypothetical protein